jgi:hypothetical protein
MRMLIVVLILALPMATVPACRDSGSSERPVEFVAETNVAAQREAQKISRKTWVIVSTTRPDYQTLRWVIRSGKEEKILDVFLPSHGAGWTYLMLDHESRRVRFDYRTTGYSETGANLRVADFLAPVVNTVGTPGSSSVYRRPLPQCGRGLFYWEDFATIPV